MCLNDNACCAPAGEQRGALSLAHGHPGLQGAQSYTTSKQGVHGWDQYSTGCCRFQWERSLRGPEELDF